MVFNESRSVVCEAKPASSYQDFTNTFVLSSTPSSDRVLLEVPNALAIDPSRQRRAHQKSKRGCDNCRRRRVKCDEASPCANCNRRGDLCRRLSRSNRVGAALVPSSLPTQTLLPTSMPTDLVNLQHLKLLHHFETTTRPTLLFSPAVWDHALQLSFQFECLMNAILCVAARHLAYLQPGDCTYAPAAARHLCHALSSFRLELSNNLTSTHLDVFVATSVLLQFELWINTDFLSPQEEYGTSLDMSKDCIFTFSSSLKQVFLRSFPRAAILASEFMPCIRDNPMDKLVQAAQVSNDTLETYHQFFSYRRPLTLDLLDALPMNLRRTDEVNSQLWAQHGPREEEAPDKIEDDYRPVITRLCLILSFLPQMQPPIFVGADSPLLPTLARYCLLFPIMCFGPFASMIHDSDPHALLLLYHFYRAARILLSSGEYWWAHKRAAMMETALKAWLTRRCARQNDE